MYSDNLSSTTIKNILKNNIKLDTAELILFDSEFADIDLTEETPINRWKYLKSCVLGGHKISLVGSSMASNQEFVNELYDNSSMGIAIIEGNYDTGKKILKVKGSEIELSVDDVQFDGKNYKIYTKLGILNSLKPVTLSSNIVSYVGETVFILLDSGYCESNRE